MSIALLTTSQGIQVVAPQSVESRPWGTEILVALGPGYMGKVLYRRAGSVGDLQFHRAKHETHFLLEGRAALHCEDGHGEIVVHEMGSGCSVSIPPGAVHRVVTLTDCTFFESSTPHFEDRVNVSALYGDVADADGLPTTARPLTAKEAGIEWL